MRQWPGGHRMAGSLKTLKTFLDTCPSVSWTDRKHCSWSKRSLPSGVHPAEDEPTGGTKSQIKQKWNSFHYHSLPMAKVAATRVRDLVLGENKDFTNRPKTLNFGEPTPLPLSSLQL